MMCGSCWPRGRRSSEEASSSQGDSPRERGPARRSIAILVGRHAGDVQQALLQGVDDVRVPRAGDGATESTSTGQHAGWRLADGRMAGGAHQRASRTVSDSAGEGVEKAEAQQTVRHTEGGQGQ